VCPLFCDLADVLVNARRHHTVGLDGPSTPVDRVNDPNPTPSPKSLACPIDRAELRRFLRMERRIRQLASTVASAPEPKQLVKPEGAETLLDALSAVYAPGDVVTTADVVRIGGTKTAAPQLRRWALAVGLWPWKQSSGAISLPRRKDRCGRITGNRSASEMAMPYRGPGGAE
jgi:hypothetical protein